MRKLLLGLLVLIGLTVPTERASAWYYNHGVPYPSTAAFPAMNPPGWYTNTYYYAWYYPWYAYYNYSHGPYANWMSGGGYAYYGNLGHYRMTRGVAAPVVAPSNGGSSAPCTLTVNMPTDAKLLFNGAIANGTGGVRTYRTPELQSGVDYVYDLTAEVMRNGKTEHVTKRVVVRAGEKTSVTLGIDVVNAVGTR